MTACPPPRPVIKNEKQLTENILKNDFYASNDNWDKKVYVNFISDKKLMWGDQEKDW